MAVAPSTPSEARLEVISGRSGRSRKINRVSHIADYPSDDPWAGCEALRSRFAARVERKTGQIGGGSQPRNGGI